MFNDEKSKQISDLGLKVGTEISKENDLVKIGNNETLNLIHILAININ